jgi:acetolactate synthase II small subunit
MNMLIKMNVSRAPGALVRVLGTVERRGYRPVDITGHEPVGFDDGMELRLVVESDRPGSLLVQYLEKLSDVKDLKVEL